MDSHKILEAVDEAAREISEIDAKLSRLQQTQQRLQQRASQLRNFVTLGKSLFGVEDITEASPIDVGMEEGMAAQDEISVQYEAHEDYTVADWARRLLEETGRPMRVPEIAKTLVERGWVKPKNAGEVIRTAMARREDFERIALGLYALKEWPPVLKRLSQKLYHPTARRKRHILGQQQSLPKIARLTLNEAQKPLTFRQIIEMLEAQGKEVNKPSLLRGIYRCIEQGRLFYLESPGTFGLLEWQEELPQQRDGNGEDSGLFAE
jgi:hypothetical protein